MKFLLTALALLLHLPLLAQPKKLATEHVILITLDGFRWQELFGGIDSTLLHTPHLVADSAELRRDFWAATPALRRSKLLPFFWRTIATQGQLYGNRWLGSRVNVTNTQWFSYPGYNEILTGFADERITSNDKVNNVNQTVLEHLHQQPGFAGKVAAYGSWDVFPYIINAERSHISVNAGYAENPDPNAPDNVKMIYQLQAQVPRRWDNVRFDAFTHHLAKACLETQRPRVLYIAYGETDDFAHEGEYAAYIRSAHQTDAFIEDLWTFVQRSPTYKNKTTLIITTDHGRGHTPPDSWKHHSKDVPGADQIWLAFIGPDTRGLGEVRTAGQHHQNQVAKTLAALLGFDYRNVRPVGAVIGEVVGK